MPNNNDDSKTPAWQPIGGGVSSIVIPGHLVNFGRDSLPDLNSSAVKPDSKRQETFTINTEIPAVGKKI